MSHLTLGLICGLAFGVVTVGVMLPFDFPGRGTAMPAAFVNRFGIGLVIPFVTLSMPYWASGLIISILLSVPAAIVSRRYAPILGLGALGGIVIGYVAGRVG